MKINKPSYNAGLKLYTCELTDGFRLSLKKEEGQPLSLPSEYESQALKESLLKPIIDGTKGWFTKPLSEEWLSTRISFDIPTNMLPADFDGVVDYRAVKLVISKDAFTFECSVSEMKPAEKVIIDFKEEPAIEEKQDLPLETATPVGIGPTRRTLQKQIVMKAREKAARALFKAERLTQEYSQLYGEETDWENDEGSETDN
jgi:hypothetical protein